MGSDLCQVRRLLLIGIQYRSQALSPQFQLILMERCGDTFDVRAIRILMNRLARSR